MSSDDLARPRISILSAVHNEAHHVTEMIKSVQAQDLPEWEILFVDDGSTDDTAKLIQEHASADPRVRLISHGLKLGKVKAFNTAKEASRGDVIVLLAGDDRLPQGSLRTRWREVSALPTSEPCVGFFKIRTFSTKKKYDGMVLPRGDGASRSGGSIAMNRAMADVLFPIDESLVAEDIWLAYGSADIAVHMVEMPDLVLDYRIHDGNSNPRDRPFAEMTESMHKRHRAWKALLDCERIPLSPDARRELDALWSAEELRYRGKLPALIARPTLPLVERAALASMASPALYWVRKRFYRFFSGRRESKTRATIMDRPPAKGLTTTSMVMRSLALTLLLIGALFPGQGKVQAFAAICCAPLVAWELLRRRNIHPAIRFAAPLFATIALSGLLIPPTTAYGHTKLTNVLTITLFSALAASLIRDAQHLRVFACVWTGAGILLAAVALLGATGVGGLAGRATGFGSNPIGLARPIGSALVVLFWLTVQRSLRPWVAAVFGLVLLAGLFATGSKGPFIAAVLALAAVTFSERMNLARIRSAVIVAVIGYGVVLATPSLRNSRLGHIATDPGGIIDPIRADALRRTWPVLITHPLGVGYGNWFEAVSAKGAYYPHNLWAELATEGGWLPGAALVFGVGLVCVRLWKQARLEPVAGLALGLLVFEMFNVSVSGDLNARTFFCFVLLGFIVGMWYRKRPNRHTSTSLAGPTRNPHRAEHRSIEPTSSAGEDLPDVTGHSLVANHILVVTLDAYRFSTRSRKAAIQYLSVAPTTFLGLSGAGRTGRWDKPGNFVADGVDVRQLYIKQLWVAPTWRSQIRNLFLGYVPALARMAIVVLRTPADVVHVTGAPLVLLGLLHRARFGSRMVLDVNERPGVVAAKGSLASTFSRVELSLLRHASRRVDVATVVTHGDIEGVSALGFRTVALVRNAPLTTWRAPYTPPPDVDGCGLKAVVIGTVYEGRGYEILLRALAKVKHQRNIHVKIYGPGREDYLASLKRLTQALDITDRVEWMGRTDSSEVSAAYLSAHVGLVLYETFDSGNDGLSNKILECVSTGRPVIAGDLPENRRFVTENGVGWLTDVTVDALAEALRSACLGEDIAALGAKCRQYGDTWLNWESEFATVLAIVNPRPKVGDQ